MNFNKWPIFLFAGVAAILLGEFVIKTPDSTIYLLPVALGYIVATIGLG